MLGEKTWSAPGHRFTKKRGRPAAPAANPLETAVDRARRCLLSLQKPDGHWCAELQGDTILESEYILMMAFLGQEDDPKVRKAANYIVTQERPDGGWSNYPGGPADLNVSVKAYFALKITGHDPNAPYMTRARELIRELGGAARCNSFTKFYLCFLGQFPYDNCPSVPVEMMLLPRWAYFNLYAMSAWTRTIVVPLSVFSACKPVRPMPPERCIPELFLEPQFKPLHPCPPTKRLLTASNFFLAVDYAIKFLERWAPKFIRRRAVAKAEEWMLQHFEQSDGIGAIFPPIIYTVISLHCLGYGPDSVEMKYNLKQLDDLMIEDGETIRLQPCFSPVWDTALALNALGFAGAADGQPGVARAGRWLLEREVRRAGDWSLQNPSLEPAGWFFEYRNSFYPDTDDTAMVLMGLARCGLAADAAAGRDSDARPQRLPSIDRAIAWLLGMQNKDGGWAAFDRDINREILTKVPFADHNAMLDPSCPDITARVLEALAQFGIRAGHPQVDKGIAFILNSQDKRGCWIGRWGVNYLYGTWQVLVGLEACGYDRRQDAVRRAVVWLNSVQQSEGGWGESCKSYDDPRLAGMGAVTASQTGWALLGLMAAGETESDSVRRGIDYLLRTQGPDGNWEESEFTGTGFPKVFYLKYHHYRLYFPLMALARYQTWQKQQHRDGYVWDSGTATDFQVGN